MIRGDENPIIIFGSNEIQLPSPKIGEREEQQEDETKTFKNIYHNKVQGENRYRFKATYRFSPPVDRDLYEILQDKINRYNKKCTLIPYSDLDFQTFKCRANLTYEYYQDLPKKRMILKLTQIDTDKKKYTIDSTIIAHNYIGTSTTNGAVPSDNNIIGSTVKTGIW